MSAERYRIYGLVVESELSFDHWPKAVEFRQSRPADVVIKTGPIPKDWDDRMLSGHWYLVERDHIFVRIENVGRFLISNGVCVVYDPSGDSHEDAWLYVEGVITGAVLHQRQVWPLHGSAVLKPNGEVAAFVGPRGIGKSTLLFELQNRGFPVVSDDIVAIELDPEGQPMVYPGFPQGKLCLDAVESFGLDVAHLKPLQNAVRDKFAVTYHSAFVDTPRQLSEVFLLERHERFGLDCCELSGLNKLRQLSDNTYRLELLATNDDYQRLFRNITTAARYVRAFRLCRPAEGNSVKELGRFLEGQWRK